MTSQSSKPRRSSTVIDPYATPGVYYGENHDRKHARARTYSAVSHAVALCNASTQLTAIRL